MDNLDNFDGICDAKKEKNSARGIESFQRHITVFKATNRFYG